MLPKINRRPALECDERMDNDGKSHPASYRMERYEQTDDSEVPVQCHTVAFTSRLEEEGTDSPAVV